MAVELFEEFAERYVYRVSAPRDPLGPDSDARLGIGWS